MSTTQFLPITLVVSATLCILTYATWRAWKGYVQQVIGTETQKNEQRQSHFLAVMGHEIRTPMNAILASLDLLTRTPLTASQKELMMLAHSASETLLDLLDDVLDLSKIRTKQLVLEKSPVDMVALIQQTMDICQVHAQEKGLPIYFNTPLSSQNNPHTLPYVITDPIRMRQILLNLLSNAIKFTERGNISIKMHLQPMINKTGHPHQHENNHVAMLVISIQDTGIGISLEKQKKIFEPFMQVSHDASARRYGGTGLGLTICHELVQCMHGYLRIESQLGRGTTVISSFPVTTVLPTEKNIPAKIPLPDAPWANIKAVTTNRATTRYRLVSAMIVAKAEEDTQASVNTIHHRHILVVEHHLHNRLVIEHQLHALRCQVTLLEEGNAALAILSQPHNFSLMLLDCYLPKIDAYHIAQKVRQIEKNAHQRLGIIGLSALIDYEHTQRCIESGMDGLLKKPLQLKELENVIKEWGQ